MALSRTLEEHLARESGELLLARCRYSRAISLAYIGLTCGGRLQFRANNISRLRRLRCRRQANRVRAWGTMTNEATLTSSRQALIVLFETFRRRN